ncbi:MAG: DUF4199 domain-containing protein [Prevotella sp.]|nr:DUF4199 domain-containing protein [Prevotella sp.]
MDESFKEKLIQLKAYARIDGLIVGAVMCLSFACMLAGFRNGIMSMFSFVLMLSVAFTAYYLTVRFRNKILNGNISFRRAYAYCLYGMLYGALLLAAFQLIYFLWFDNGYFVSQYISILQEPVNKDVFAQAGVKDAEIKQIVALLTQMRPIDMTIQFLTTNIFLSAVVSIVIALFARSADRKHEI